MDLSNVPRCTRSPFACAGGLVNRDESDGREPSTDDRQFQTAFKAATFIFLERKPDKTMPSKVAQIP